MKVITAYKIFKILTQDFLISRGKSYIEDMHVGEPNMPKQFDSIDDAKQWLVNMTSIHNEPNFRYTILEVHKVVNE